jgi:hypothetical protein
MSDSTGYEEFHGSVQRKGLEHRIRNAFAAVPAGNGPFRTGLFSLRILVGPSITSRLVSCAATELGSKMVARCSVFVR